MDTGAAAAPQKLEWTLGDDYFALSRFDAAGGSLTVGGAPPPAREAGRFCGGRGLETRRFLYYTIVKGGIMALTTQQPQMGLTFEDVWAALMETRARQEEIGEQMRQTGEQMRQADEQMRRTMEEQRRQAEEEMRKTKEMVDQTTANVDKMAAKVDRVSENLGGVNRSLGELIETLIAARLWEKFDAYHYNFQRPYQRVPLYDENNRALTDIDILLSDGDYVMATEVKREFDKKDDVTHHLKRMELIKKYPPAECKGKKLLGAIAGGIVDTDVRDYAHSVGFFVLELTGESVQLAETPSGFTPQQW